MSGSAPRCSALHRPEALKPPYIHHIPMTLGETNDKVAYSLGASSALRVEGKEKLSRRCSGGRIAAAHLNRSRHVINKGVVTSFEVSTRMQIMPVPAGRPRRLHEPTSA